MPIIQSTTEQDLYKFNMCAVILRHHPETPVSYKFINRSKGTFLPPDMARNFINHLTIEIEHMAQLRTTDEEIAFMEKRCGYLPPQMMAFIKNFRYNPDQLTFDVDKDGQLVLSIDGLWETAIMWEVPLMAVISELYFKLIDKRWESEGWLDRQRRSAWEKAQMMNSHDLYVAEGGLRRRHSYAVQDAVIKTLSSNSSRFLGTSNVHMAMKHNLKPMGTMAHELIMGYSALTSLRHANRYALQDWAETFQGEMGIALPDTFGTEAFIKDFNPLLARSFDGVRHDSGNPFVFGNRIIENYKSMGIDPKSKSIVFSNGLTMDDAWEIHRYFDGKIKVVTFFIGTHCTNDFPEHKALNMVIKMDQCDGVDVVKLSDDHGKETGKSEAIEVAHWTHKIENIEGYYGVE